MNSTKIETMQRIRKNKTNIGLMAYNWYPKSVVNRLKQILKDDPSQGFFKDIDAINLGNSEIETLKPLVETLTSVKNLIISKTKIENLNGLEKMKKLTGLWADCTKIEDLSPLKNLRSMTILDVKFTKVKDLSPIECLGRMEKLYLSGTGVSDLTFLKKMLYLSHLEIDGTKVVDLSPISELKYLKKLVVDKNVDLSPIQNLMRNGLKIEQV